MRYHELLESTRDDILHKIVNDDLRRLRQAFQIKDRDIRFVGGAVRDILSGKTPKDIDLATDATPEEQIDIYKLNGFRYIETGIDHGTITVVINHTPYEITSLRTESEHDGRRAKVAYTRDWIEDLSRRDLTVNAMALTFDGDLIDPFGGQHDLQRGVVKFVGNAAQRMTEDYLRILRFFRFHGRQSSDGLIDAEADRAIRENTPGLAKISGERIWMETAKILVGPNGPREIRKMCELGVAKAIGLPCKNIEPLRRTYKLSREPVTLLCAILDTPDEVAEIVRRWKLSGEERGLAEFLVRHKGEKLKRDDYQNMVVAASPTAVEWVKKAVAELARLQGKQMDAVAMAAWKVPEFPVAGRDLMALGMRPGPEVGKLLVRLKALWVESRFKLSRDELLASLRTKTGTEVAPGPG